MQEKALERANKRLSLVKRRVSDGINLKADLFRAQSTQIFQEEQLDQARQEFNQSIYFLSNLLHRKVLPNEVGTAKSIESDTKVFSLVSKFAKSELLINSKKLLADSQELDRNLKARKMMPELNLAMLYQTNDFDPNSTNVLENGNLSGDRNTVSVGFTFTYNFGRVSERAELTQSEINHNQALHELSAAHQNIKERKTMLQSNIKLSEQNIRKATKRVNLSASIIQEYLKLFSLGRVTLDQVIQAEEDLINSQRRLAQQTIASFNQRVELISLEYFLPDLISEGK